VQIPLSRLRIFRILKSSSLEGISQVLERFEQVGAGGYCREGNVLEEDWQKPLDSPMLLLQILVEHLIGRPHQFAYLLQSLNQHIARHDKHRGTQLLIGNETILLICRLARGRRGGG
jgi:hypothetical protein